MPKQSPPPMRKLAADECVYYRDQFRAARYAALADAEGFGAICFALEALGLRLLGQRGDLHSYEPRIRHYAAMSLVLNTLAKKSPSRFKTFDALFRTVRTARNDAMHLGAYARHATEASIELCIGLEEALMSAVKPTVGNVMVKSPICVEPWQPVAHARQLMLMHSFSFLPVRIDNAWYLVSELGLAKFLSVKSDKKLSRLGSSIADAHAATVLSERLVLIPVAHEALLSVSTPVSQVLGNAKIQDGPILWLVKDEFQKNHLAGILSPFELM